MIIHVCVNEIRIRTSYTFDTSHAESALLYTLHTSRTLYTLHPCLYSQYRGYSYTCEFVLLIGLFMTIFMCECECLILWMPHSTNASFYEWRLICIIRTTIIMRLCSTKSRHADLSVSRGTNSSWDFGLIWICTEEFEFLDVVEIMIDVHHWYICEWGMSWHMWMRYVNEACDSWHMTDSTKNAIPPKSTTSRNSNFSVQIQIKPKSQLEFVPRDTERSECLDLVDCGSVAISVETVLCAWGTS